MQLLTTNKYKKITAKAKMQIKKYKMELISIPIMYTSDPTLIFNQICFSKKNTLLLESSDINIKQNLESIIIIDSAIRISCIENIVILEALSQNGIVLFPLLDSLLPKTIKVYARSNYRRLTFPKMLKDVDEDNKLCLLSVFDCLRILLHIIDQPSNFSKQIFLGGLFSYDLINNFEKLPKLKKKNSCPYYCFYLSETLLIFDHKIQKCNLQCSIFSQNCTEKQRLKDRMKQLQDQLSKPLRSINKKIIKNMTLSCNKNDKQYIEMITKMQEKISIGEIFQVVPSRSFYLPCYSSLAAYNELKMINPSPYMFFMQDKDFTLFGASPESSLKYNHTNRQIEIYPIAGTRPRGYNKDGSINIDFDNRIELDMKTDHKELAEHIMLVDLARNDLAKICVPGTRYISELMKVDRYSHVMHLVSKIIGTLRNNLDALHAYCACMNMGTLSGAPKVRAMQIIAELEQETRGSYGGSIGYITSAGDLDTCIIIRSAYIENNIATIQSGAGIVLDSIPQLEANESKNKALAVLDAIVRTHTIS